MISVRCQPNVTFIVVKIFPKFIFLAQVVSRLDVDVVSSVLDQLNALKIFVGKHCLTQVQLR